VTTNRNRQTPRAARRPRRGRVQPHESFLGRNRIRLLWAGGLAVIVVLAGMAYLSATSPAYACGSLFEPTPGPGTPATSGPDGSPAPSIAAYVEPDMGQGHLPGGTFVRYLFCPPASGRHFFGTGIGPIRAQVYGPEERIIPQNWIHNLEHGGLVLLYRCPADACDPAGQARLEQLYRDWPNSPICGFARGEPNGLGSPVIARFDEMAWPYAALVWGVVMPLDAFDEGAILDFYAAYAERFNPEPFCQAPTPTPGPTGTPEPTASPSESPAATAPAESPGASPS